MEKSQVFEKNLKALSEKNPALSALLSKAEIRKPRYTFQNSRTGERVPALFDQSDKARPLHSLMDPHKEAKRLIDAEEGGCFLIFLGLGAGSYAEAALERKDTAKVLVIEFDVNGAAELFNNIDYTRLICDPRFALFVDPSEAELNKAILDLYQPVLSGKLKVIPLRPRTSFLDDAHDFTQAADIIANAIEKVSADYSVQAHFGKRWFSNIISNFWNFAGADQGRPETPPQMPPVKKAAVCAAGPSLLPQIEMLQEKRADLFIIAADTSLPCLLHNKISPDAVVSIDCQHISYYHFMDGLPEEVPLFLDLASPPLLASLSKKRRFFSCGHPLTSYISWACGKLPELDSSGGNVTYAAVSLAEQLGAAEIELYGADYSYPGGVSYAKGAYIYSFFDKKASRFSPAEAQASAFIYRTPLEKISKGDSWYYQTKTMNFYREKLEEKSKFMEAAIMPIKGRGAPVCIQQKKDRLPGAAGKNQYTWAGGNAEKPGLKTVDFLLKYSSDIKKLPAPENSGAGYMDSLSRENQAILTTLLPVAAAIKHRHPEMGFPELLEEVKKYCCGKIDSLRI